MNPGRDPDLKRALRPVPTYERAVREISRMLSEAGIRHALVGALAANAYRSRPRTTEDIAFLVGDEAFQRHAGGFVTMRVPVVEFDGIDVDQVPLTEGLRVVDPQHNHAALIAGPCLDKRKSEHVVHLALRLVPREGMFVIIARVLAPRRGC
jgi:hypothetical protein